jgi:hypothetical protein
VARSNHPSIEPTAAVAEQRLKVLEAFRSVAVGFEKDLLATGFREVALILGSARQAAEEVLAAEDSRPSSSTER